MGYAELETLGESYPRQAGESLMALAQEYRNRDEREVLTLAAIAADVSLDSVLNLRLEPAADAQFMEAFQLQYPNVDIDSLRGASEEQLAGWANGAKGKYFEVLVRDRLNAGESVGELQLQPGQVATLAESPTQPGIDLIIKNQDGSTDGFLQLKASESLGYIRRALDTYPDITVVTPSEVDDAADDIIGTDISNEELERITQSQINEMGESAFNELLDKGAEAILDSVPLVSMVATGVIEGRNLLAGRHTLRESLRRGAERTGRAAVYNVLGSLLGPAGVPIALTVRVAETRMTGRIALGDHLESKTLEIRRRTPQAQLPP